MTNVLPAVNDIHNISKIWGLGNFHDRFENLKFSKNLTLM